MNSSKVNEYGSESGYSSDSSGEECLAANFCPWCDTEIGGPRIGFVVHLGVKHTQQRMLDISKLTTASEMHKIAMVRQRQIQRTLGEI